MKVEDCSRGEIGSKVPADSVDILITKLLYFFGHSRLLTQCC